MVFFADFPSYITSYTALTIGILTSCFLRIFATKAAELGPRNIRVGCILPGAVSTELNLRAGLFAADEASERYDAVAGLHALGRIGTGTEVAEGVEYLMRAEWVTGVDLEVDGGIGLGVSHF